MTLVKVCGIRTVEEGLTALDAGADWLGFVLWPHSRRAISASDAAQVIRTLRAGRHWDWCAVGVFVNPSMDQVHEAMACDLDYMQLSGHEDDSIVRNIDLPVIKAIHVRDGHETAAAHIVTDNSLGAQRYLLDTHSDGMYGGTGSAFDWAALRAVGPQCLIAGGLTPDNVVDAMSTLSPYGVDVSSGVEYPAGGKDPTRVRAFLEAVRQHDASLAARG